MTGPEQCTIRDRRPTDLPALVAALAGQQAASRYPMRWPLPFPVEDFIVRPTEEWAWVAELDGEFGREVVGHVAAGAPDDPDLAAAFVAGTGTDRLAMVSVLFTSAAARGLGVGGLLLDTAVAWIRAQDRLPVLDVVQLHGDALEVYRHRGWVEVGRTRFAWLPADQPEVLLMALPSV